MFPKHRFNGISRLVSNLLFQANEDDPHLVHPAGALLAAGPNHASVVSFSLVAIDSISDRQYHPGSAHQAFEGIIPTSISPHTGNLSQVEFCH